MECSDQWIMPRADFEPAGSQQADMMADAMNAYNNFCRNSI